MATEEKENCDAPLTRAFSLKELVLKELYRTCIMIRLNTYLCFSMPFPRLHHQPSASLTRNLFTPHSPSSPFLAQGMSSACPGKFSPSRHGKEDSVYRVCCHIMSSHLFNSAGLNFKTYNFGFGWFLLHSPVLTCLVLWSLHLQGSKGAPGLYSTGWRLLIEGWIAYVRAW